MLQVKIPREADRRMPPSCCQKWIRPAIRIASTSRWTSRSSTTAASARQMNLFGKTRMTRLGLSGMVLGLCTGVMASCHCQSLVSPLHAMLECLCMHWFMHPPPWSCALSVYVYKMYKYMYVQICAYICIYICMYVYIYMYIYMYPVWIPGHGRQPMQPHWRHDARGDRSGGRSPPSNKQQHLGNKTNSTIDLDGGSISPLIFLKILFLVQSTSFIITPPSKSLLDGAADHS